MFSYWAVNAAGEVLSKQYSCEKKGVFLGPSIVDGLGCNQHSDDFELIPDGTRLTVDFVGTEFEFVSCFASTPFCPKRYLKELLDDPSLDQSALQIGIELEFYILPLGSSFASTLAPGEHAYKLTNFVARQKLQRAIYNLLKSLGIEHFCLHAEGGDGQFELSFGISHPYEIATKYALLRSLLPGLALDLGYQLILSPRPFEGQFVNALHINFSWKNYTRDQQFRCAEKIAMSSPYYQLVYNPTEESYLALKDPIILDCRPKIDAWVANDVRNSVIRYVERDERFEFRLPDPSANIFSVISAMILSFRNEMEVPNISDKVYRSSLMNSSLSESRGRFEEVVLSVPKEKRIVFLGLGGLLRDETAMQGIV